MHIAIAGNIGSGKTTLTSLLAKHYKWDAQFEDVDDNPYLNDFYKDMQRWSFNLQIYFLKSRFGQIQKIHSEKKDVIQDRTIYEDAYIFAPNLHSMGLMSTRDYENYFSLKNSDLIAENNSIYFSNNQNEFLQLLPLAFLVKPLLSLRFQLRKLLILFF